MTPEMALALMLIATPANSDTFADRWPHVNAVESTGSLLRYPSTVVPPVLVVQDEDKPPASRHRRQATDICTRHHMHKVVTRGGKSWRCRK